MHENERPMPQQRQENIDRVVAAIAEIDGPEAAAAYREIKEIQWRMRQEALTESDSRRLLELARTIPEYLCQESVLSAFISAAQSHTIPAPHHHEVLDLARERLNDENDTVRLGGVVLVGMLSDRASRPRIEQLATDPSQQVRDKAKSLLEHWQKAGW